MQKKWVIGNWKMHGSRALAEQLVQATLKAENVQPVLCCPFTLLSFVHGLTRDTAIKLGAQDCHALGQGAFTGDICAAMLMEAGCTHVIIGHSERRQHHGETDTLVHQKAQSALAAGLNVILCIGESGQEREQGKAKETITRQLNESMPRSANSDRLLIAYEPIWAIGTGKTPTVPDITEIHTLIKYQAPGFPVLYGGSVNPGNASEILRLPEVDGVLVGGASLDPEGWAKILSAHSQ